MKWATFIMTIVLFITLALNAQAEGLHMDIGVAYHDAETDSFEQKDKTNISNLIGEAELSYEWENGTIIFIRHINSPYY